MLDPMKTTNDTPICDEMCIHRKQVESVTASMPDIDTLYDLAELYRIFGDSTRIRILCALFEGEMCVCDIAEALDMTVSAISHQLRILKSSRLVKFRRNGKTCYYCLADSHVKTIIGQGVEHLTEE